MSNTKNITSRPNNRLTPLWKTILVLALVASVYAVFQQMLNSPKLAYVDTTRVLEEYQGMRDAKQMYEKSLEQWQSRTDTLRSEFESQIKEFEQQKASLKKEAKARALASLEQKKQEVQKYREYASKEAIEKEAQMTNQILQQMNAFIQDYGKKQGYLMILGANGQGSLLYAEESIDITDEVIKLINQGYKKL